MYIELILASIATFLWWNSHPGVFNQLCLDVMFVSSVSTLMFNANPLMRYDGYYILSDLLEIPNLRQKATTILGRLASLGCLGIEQPEDPFLPTRKRGLFALFAIASSLYGWMVTASIFLFVWSVFKPYRLEVLGQMLAMGALWGLVVRPIQNIIKFLNVPGRREEVKLRNLVTTGAVVAALAAAVALIPLPQRVWCAAELRPRAEETVYVSVAGVLEPHRGEAGSRWSRPAPRSLGSPASISIWRSPIFSARPPRPGRDWRASSRERFTDPAASLEIGTVEESLKSVEEQLKRKRKDRADLVLTAPRSGVVLPSPALKAPRTAPAGSPGGVAMSSRSGTSAPRLPRGRFSVSSVIRTLSRR